MQSLLLVQKSRVLPTSAKRALMSLDAQLRGDEDLIVDCEADDVRLSSHARECDAPVRSHLDACTGTQFVDRVGILKNRNLRKEICTRLRETTRYRMLCIMFSQWSILSLI